MKTQERVHCDGTRINLCNPRLGKCFSEPQVDLKPTSVYKNDRVIAKLSRETGIDRRKAEQLFDETKKFLLKAASASNLEPPSKEVDAMWHAFILFTQDYGAFCRDYLGTFVHHVPHVFDGCTSDQGGSQEGGGMDCNSGGDA